MKIIEKQNTNEIFEVLTRSSSSSVVDETVSEILQNVRNKGDKALCDYTLKFDSIEISSPQIMDREELGEYVQRTKSQLRKIEVEAIDVAIENVTFVASESMPRSWKKSAAQGQVVGENFYPFNRVACYVPQGSFPLVSTAIHTAAIAKAVGVKEIVMITSPKEQELNPAVAYAAYASGVTEVVFVGGAQGIAALAYGTQTIKRADFICGPGNSFVATAKKLLCGTVGIDMVAGPSEVFVIADDSADPYCVACDLVAQAEHGSGFESSVLLTNSRTLIEETETKLNELKSKIKDNPGFEKVFKESIYLVLVDEISQAIEITNQCAPEHVEVITENAAQDAQNVFNAGAVFVGKYSAEPLGDFVAGPSHVLPTNSTARFTSGLSANSFMKRTSIIEINEEAYLKLAPLSAVFGEMEGLTGHAMSSVARMDENKLGEK